MSSKRICRLEGEKEGHIGRQCEREIASPPLTTVISWAKRGAFGARQAAFTVSATARRVKATCLDHCSAWIAVLLRSALPLDCSCTLCKALGCPAWIAAMHRSIGCFLWITLRSSVCASISVFPGWLCVRCFFFMCVYESVVSGGMWVRMCPWVSFCRLCLCVSCVVLVTISCIY